MINLNTFQDYSADKKIEEQLSSELEICDSIVSLCTEAEKKVHHVSSVLVSAFEDFQTMLIANSEGVFCKDKRIHQTFSVQASAEHKGNRTSCSERGGMSNLTHFLSSINVENIAQKVSESCNIMLNAGFVEAFQGTAVLANRFGGVIFHEACGHLLETTQLERKSTPFADKIGEKIAHEALTAWDEGITKNAFGSTQIDDEGMPSQSTLLIENGVLKNYISDRMGHLKTGAPRTGSGRRQNFTYAAASRMRNTFIAAGKHSPEEIISSVEKGIYCKKMGGGSVGATGEFNFGVQEAYLIEKGKLTTPVKGATLIGEAQNIMNQISMCGNDLELAAGFCGSVSGSIYTTVGQPHIKVDKITVGGRTSGN
jgi:TldD protein